MLGEVERLRGMQRTNAQGVLSCTDGPEGYQHRIYSGALGLCDVFASSDARLIMESLNFLRSAAFEEMVRDAGRLDYIERTFSGMTNRERYLPVQMIWGGGCNGRTLREACDKYMKRDTAMSAEHP